jgi:hypothetical protein
MQYQHIIVDHPRPRVRRVPFRLMNSTNAPSISPSAPRKVPIELQQLNKRSVHRAMEIMGARAAMRAGTELQALAFTTEASRTYMSTFRRDGASVKQQLDQRDSAFGDYRTRKT